jgi:uncharacterized protein YodC (DUF2158 family)
LGSIAFNTSRHTLYKETIINFKIGEIVKHKLNNQKMIVISDGYAQYLSYRCRYQNDEGEWLEDTFREEELENSLNVPRGTS